MGLPKGFRKNIKLTKPKVGFERRQELLDDIDNQGTFLPRGIAYEDMDVSMIDMVNSDLGLVIEGEKVPVIFLTIQKWAEFNATWTHSDKYKNVKIPFITVVRQPNVQVGTNQAGNWNIPGNRGYTYIKVPTFEAGRKGVDVYKIPQPTSVDVTYEVRLFCNRMQHINNYHSVVQELFNSRQHYIFPNEHPMPVHLETSSDESVIQDFNKRKYYVQLIELKLLGYILDEDNFEVIPTVNRLTVGEQVPDGDKKGRRSSDVTYTLFYSSGAVDSYTVTSEFATNFYDITNMININTVDIYIDNVLVELPIDVVGGTEIRFDITRTDNNEDSSFILNGLK